LKINLHRSAAQFLSCWTTAALLTLLQFRLVRSGTGVVSAVFGF
jgi:hypothetical protein